MADERNKQADERALVPVGEVKDAYMVGNRTGRDFVFEMLTQSDDKWKEALSERDRLTDLAMGLRLADALNLPVRAEYLARVRQMAAPDEGRFTNDFTFAFVRTLLTDVYDEEYAKDWDLPEMGEEIRKWCVDVLEKRLIDLVGRTDEEAVKELVAIRDIITRSSLDETAFDQSMTYLKEEEANELEDHFTEEEQALVNEKEWQEMERLARGVIREMEKGK